MPVGISHRGTPNGYQRITWNIRNGTAGAAAALAELYDVLFAGQRSVDWESPFTAPVDHMRVKSYYDRTHKITHSHNGGGDFKNYKFWHPINRTIIYDEDENGDLSKSSSEFANGSGINNMGDLFVFDMFQCVSGREEDQLAYSPQGTYFWHEGSGR